jgi:hypothetical protein
MTWLGHEFLDSVRDPDIWRKTKEGASVAGSIGFEIVLEIAKGWARQKAQNIGIPLS